MIHPISVDVEIDGACLAHFYRSGWLRTMQTKQYRTIHARKCVHVITIFAVQNTSVS